ncbi:hypothetical protein EYA84_02180 [Verrucosispora sp. SN26_14.1]|uniref:hypothetical protein n=1 Tax=Verrucosispora sp. SN26_14.1 TaxID=2527879 RepID=UPI0010344EC3|nr:hypothetical protein [Verrucosispora sp. SN26_14.1]TBL44272.1 hypothetical protein EYA84_02180 [Verrucosispora sp. SN26_14.1]
MARIRSIKPEFFTSEVVASVPISARLTFIGLWTHVDDNGVTVDNPKLITAALWPLEDDPREALARTSGDLASLSTAGLIQRYEASGRQYLYIVGWDEHQRVSHPSKARYPRPTEPPTSGNEPEPAPSGNPPENLPSPPENLVPEQGAGSREQGTGNRDSAPRKRGTRLPDDFAVTDEMKAWFATNCPGVNGSRETEKFRNYWRSAAGQKGVKLDWPATWRNWMLTAAERGSSPITGSRTTGANRHTDQRGGGHDPNPFRTGEAVATYASQTTGSSR